MVTGFCRILQGVGVFTRSARRVLPCRSQCVSLIVEAVAVLERSDMTILQRHVSKAAPEMAHAIDALNLKQKLAEELRPFTR